MPRRGRTINVFLIDGEANSKIKVSITNWNGVAYKIPRKMLDECRGYEAFSQSGVYFLFGSNAVYVGQAEVRQTGGALYRRVYEHTSDRLQGLWDEVVIFTSKDNSMGKTEISFLENFFYEKSVQAGRYTILNNNTPSPGTVTEEKRCELEEYADSAELILGVLGYKVFEPKEESNTASGTTTSGAPVSTPPSGEGTDSPSSVTTEPTGYTKPELPQLPDASLAIGKYVQEAMKNLESVDYPFSEEQFSVLTTPEKSKKTLGVTGRTRDIPALKVYDESEDKPHYVDGFMRYYSPNGKKGQTGFVLTFKGVKYLLTKEWYEGQRTRFNQWYNGLK